jgi:hypothetical protein
LSMGAPYQLKYVSKFSGIRYFQKFFSVRADPRFLARRQATTVTSGSSRHPTSFLKRCTLQRSPPFFNRFVSEAAKCEAERSVLNFGFVLARVLVQ